MGRPQNRQSMRPPKGFNVSRVTFLCFIMQIVTMQAMRRSAMDKPTERPMIRLLLVFLGGKPAELNFHSKTEWVSLMVPVDEEKPKYTFSGRIQSSSK